MPPNTTHTPDDSFSQLSANSEPDSPDDTFSNPFSDNTEQDSLDATFPKLPINTEPDSPDDTFDDTILSPDTLISMARGEPDGPNNSYIMLGEGASISYVDAHTSCNFLESSDDESLLG